MKRIRVTAVGDIMVHQAQLDASYNKEIDNYNFSNYFNRVRKYIKNDDIDVAICNFETTMAGGKVPYSGYPRFSSPEQLAKDLKTVGFDVACTANNHAYDTKQVGIVETKRILEENGFVVSGTRSAIDDSGIGYFINDDVKIGIISYTYQSASKDGKITINGRILDDKSAKLINSYSEETLESDLIKMEEDIRFAKLEGCNIVICFFHWGNEYDTESQVHQRYIAYKLAEFGADAIIGSHPHVCQEVDEIQIKKENGIKRVPVFYSLGNFVSDMRGDIGGRETSNCGMIADIVFEISAIGDVTATGKAITTYVDIWKEKGKNNYRIIPFCELEKNIVHDLRGALERRNILRSVICRDKAALIEKYYFDEVIKIGIGESFDLASYLGIGEVESVHSDAGLVASVFRNGYVLGNSKGMAGITISTLEDGVIEKKYMLMVSVNGKETVHLPTCINQDNLFKDDLWIPRDLVLIKELDPTCLNFKIRKNVAVAYLLMKAYAKEQGIIFTAKAGHRMKRGQLNRRNDYIKANGKEKVNLRYDGHGYSEHLTGEALDLYGVNVDNTELRKWLLKNGHKFGFILRRLSENGIGTDFNHVRYVGDSLLARFITSKDLSVEEFLMNFHKLSEEKSTFEARLIEENKNSVLSGLWQLTIRQVCNILDVESPNLISEFMDMPIRKISLRSSKAANNQDIHLLSVTVFNESAEFEEKVREYFAKGAITVITDCEVLDEGGNPLPCILVDDYRKAIEILTENKIINKTIPITGVDPYDIWDGEKCEFTLSKISAICGLEIPEYLNSKKDIEVTDLSYNKISTDIITGQKILFVTIYNPDNAQFYANFIENGGILVSGRYVYDGSKKVLPAIYLPDSKSVRKAWRTIGEYIKNMFPMPTICITGSVGKTTTTEFAEVVLSERYDVFATGGNLNHPDEIVKQMIRRFHSGYNLHVQETGGGSPGLVETSANLLKPDLYCVTNVYPHHLDFYNSIENVLYDKVSFDRIYNKEVCGIINIDDDQLATYSFENKCIKVSLSNIKADVYAENIKQNGEFLEFDVVYFGERFPIRISIVGKHNIYNALIVVVMAKYMKMTIEEIQKGFLKYKARSIRQAIRNINGRLFYLDCFNICKDSLFSSIETLCELEVDEGNRRIAIVTGENALGEQAYDTNYKIGCELNKFSNIDEFICVGPKEPACERDYNNYGHGRAVYDGALSTIDELGKVSYFDDLYVLAMKIMKETKPGDIILLKGIFRIPLFAIPDIAFGTSYLIYNQSFAKEPVQEAGFRGKYAKEINGINLIKGIVTDDQLVIPDTICGLPMFRVGRRIFAKNEVIHEIDFGSSTKSIGPSAFEGCKNIKKLVFPSNIIFLDENCFADCENLEHVVFKGVGHIETGAFKNCKNLREVEFIGDTCHFIDEYAFEGCLNFNIVAEEGTYVRGFAERKGFMSKSKWKFHFGK